MCRFVKTKNRNRILIITVDNPPVNALVQEVRQELLKAITNAERDADVSVVVLYCEGRTFVAGFDIREFDTHQGVLDPHPNQIFAAVEALPKPIIAAIHGTALGAGMELALACHYRVAALGSKMGLPEIKLGLLPGSGGTQRLPRLIGVKQALNLMIKGDPVSAQTALDLGIIDRIVAGDLLDGALALASELVTTQAALPRVRDQKIDPEALPIGFFEDYRLAVAPKTRGLFAPERIIQAVEAAVHLPFDLGLELEHELFQECLASEQSKALRHLFFAERQAWKIPDVKPDTPFREVKQVAVIGAGTMGGGIAMAFANAGFPVTLLEVSSKALQLGIDKIRKNYEVSERKGRLSDARITERMGLISGTLDYQDLAGADLVIEAVFENINLKLDIFRRLDKVCKERAILATNTSTLDVDQIAQATSRPQSVVGMHFFSPADEVRLLELVRGAKTDVEVVATVMRVAKAIGKVGVLSGVCDGFIANRMLEGYIREVGFLLLEGAKPQQIDRVISSFGLATGPCAMLDMVGLKTGAGFSRYEVGSRTPLSDPALSQRIETQVKRLGIEQRSISDEEILSRCLCPVINEGALIIDQGIALRTGDLDLVWIYGFGFPAYRGGPMHYADYLGLDQVHKQISEYQRRFGEKYWTPAPLLNRLVKENKRFSDFNAG